MNKQEYQQKLKDMESVKDFTYTSAYDAHGKGFQEAKELALSYSESLDEPEKPVVPQFVADMIVMRKNQGDSLVATLVNLGAFGDAQRWIRKGNNCDTFAKAWLFGYTIAPEKRYTVKFANEDFGTIYIGIFKRANKIGLSTLPMNNEYSKCYFTESELKELKFWNNPAFEVKEVDE